MKALRSADTLPNPTNGAVSFPPGRRQPAFSVSFSRTLFSALTLLALAAAPDAPAQLFNNLRALGSRLPVGDPSVHATNSLDGPKGIATADFNMDGRPDLAIANTDGTVTLYLGLPQGKFSPPTHLQTGAQELRGIIAADVTGDGLPDITVAAPYAGLVYIFVNHDGVFSSPTELPAWSGARNLATGDFDGDGMPDLVVAGTTNGLRQLRGTGGGAFETVTNILSLQGINPEFPKPLYVLGSFRPTDADHDEVVATHADSDLLWILAPDADGALSIQGTLTNENVHSVAIGSLTQTNAGPPDLVIASRDFGSIEIHRGSNGPGRFEQRVSQKIYVPGGPRALGIADLDGDGWNDLVVVLRNFDRVLTYHNSNGVLVAATEIPVGKSPRELVMGDFNSDGHPDVAVMNRSSMDVNVLFTHPGQAGFSGLDQVYPVDGEVVGMSVMDYNHDGRDDVIQLHRGSGEFSVRLAGTNGVLGAPTFYGIGNLPADHTLPDVNGDHIPDMVTANLGVKGVDRGSISVSLSHPDGTFGPTINYYLPPQLEEGRFYAIAAADFDNDGNIDLAVGFYDCRIVFFKGNSDGSFTAGGSHEHLFTYEARAMVTGDFDGDGDIDLAGISYYGGMVVVENKGDLLTASTLTKKDYSSRCCGGDAAAITAKTIDFNGDGDLDILVGSQKGATIYLGTTGMNFIVAPNPVGGIEFPVSSLVTGDFDGNGKLDIAVGCKVLSCVTILTREDTNSDFLPALSVDVPSGEFLATGDLDGDGKPDLIGSGSVLWTALSSRRAQSAPPSMPVTTREIIPQPVINEFLAINSNLPVDADGDRKSEFVEFFNAGTTSISLNGWKLRLRNSAGVITNEFAFPPTAFFGPKSFVVVICSETRRTLYHTGFRLPKTGATLSLVNPSGVETDSVQYPAQQENISYARYRDGQKAFVANPYPSPGRSNTDNGPVEPVASLEEFNPFPVVPDEPLRFTVNGRDDVGIVSVTVFYQRMDVIDTEVHRVILYDDGMHGDALSQDGIFSGILDPGLPIGAEIQFYLQVTDLSEQTIDMPSEPVFAAHGQQVTLYSLSVGPILPSPLEISEIVAANTNGLHDEFGLTPDWVEIRNTSASAVSLRGISLGQRFFDSGTRFTFGEGDSLNPGEHRVVFCGGPTTNTGMHAPFSLNRQGDQVLLTGLGPNGARELLDSIGFGPQGTDMAYARLGHAGPWITSIPTPREANAPGGWQGVISTDHSAFTFVYRTTTNATFTVEYADSLNAPSWTALGPVHGDGLEKTVTHPMGVSRFYRVRKTTP